MIIKKSYKRIQILLSVCALTIAPLIAVITLTKPAAADSLGTITRVTWGTVRASTAEDADGNIWFGGYRGELKKTTKSGTVTTYTTPTTTDYYLSDLTRGSDGNIWFLYSNRLGIANSSGIIKSTLLPSGVTPDHIVSGPDGNIWISSYDAGSPLDYKYYIHVYSPTGNLIRTYETGSLVAGMATNYADNSLWYTQQGDSWVDPSNSNIHVVRLTADGSKTDFSIPSYTGQARDIAYGPDGQMWFIIVNGTSSTLGKIATTGTLSYYSFSSQRLSTLATGLDGNIWATAAQDNYIDKVTPSGTITTYNTAMSGGSGPSGISTASDGNMWFLDTAGNYISKIGTGVSGSSVDNDGDGLDASAELAQNTSDFNVDSDNDGLSDYIESASNTNRDNLFCNSTATYCEYPSPSQRDIYVEADWMVRPNPGGYSMKPSATQISTVTTAFANKGIVAHFDTGQLDGGNAVMYTPGLNFTSDAGGVDFYDYKYGLESVSSPQFDESRYHIYHYMLFGEEQYNPSLTGVSHAGDDDAFIAYGMLTGGGVTSSANDLKVSSIIMHELGHNLCLTNPTISGVPAYTGQPASCRFSGVDTYAGASYPSVENYDYSLSLPDYSLGLSGSSDHDDWSALRLGDFTASDQGDPYLSNRPNNSKRQIQTQPIQDLLRKSQLR